MFEFANIEGLDGKGIITVFDSASTTTLVLRKLVRRGALKIKRKGTTQCINGIGGKTLTEEGELTLTRRDGTVVTANVNIVDEMITTRKQDDETASRLAHYSAKVIREDHQYRNVQANNFQQAVGGRIELLLGQNFLDFFPVPIKNIHGGLTITQMQVKLQEEEKFLGFAGTFPGSFEIRSSGYPRALVMQEDQEHNEHEANQVFHMAASALPLR